MSNLIDEARDIIELSLDPDFDKNEYSQKASQWLEKTATAKRVHEESTHKRGTCAICGFDLTCPSCDAN